MSSYQGTRLYLLSISIVYLSYDLAAWGNLPPRTSIWLTGYKVIFLIAAIKSVTSYIHLELNTLLERTRQLQHSTVATTSKGEVLALYKEERLSDSDSIEARYSKQAFGHRNEIPLNPYDRYNPAPVFWCCFMTVLVFYNTAHLALVPLSHTLPLFFGTPAYVFYWGAVRTTQIVLS